jgi:hypothetical protein
VGTRRVACWLPRFAIAPEELTTDRRKAAGQVSETSGFAFVPRYELLPGRLAGFVLEKPPTMSVPDGQITRRVIDHARRP